MFLSLYMIAIMIAVLFIRIIIMIAILRKYLISESLWGLWSFRTAIMLTVLTKCPIFEVLCGLLTWSQFSQNVLFLSQSSHNSSGAQTKRDLPKVDSKKIPGALPSTLVGASHTPSNPMTTWLCGSTSELLCIRIKVDGWAISGAMGKG